MFSSLKKTIEFIGLDFKKELIKIAIINFALLAMSAVVIIFTKMPIVIAFAVLIVLGVDYFFYYLYSSRKAMLIKDRSDEFVHIISYFRIFIKNKNNVYQSFNRLMVYASEWMKDKIEIMLRAIDGDKSIKPFTDFAERFDFPIARNVMISIYQMVDEGERSDHLNQFTILFEQMSRTLSEERKDRKFKSFDIISFFPVVGAAIVTLSLTFSMLMVVGDMINVF